MVTENQETISTVPDKAYITLKQMDTIVDFRRLWVYVAVWMRFYIYSLADNHPNLSAITARLYRNIPLKFYSLFQVSFGKELSEHFFELISRHILLFMQLIEAIKNDNSAIADSTTVQLYKNADKISSFLASINLYWDKSQWSNLLYQYISMQIEHIQSIVRGDYDQEITIYDRIINLAQMIGNYMGRGVIVRSK